MDSLLAQHGGAIGTIIMVLVCLNILLTAVKAIFEKVVPSPEKQAESKFYQVLAKVLAVSSSIIDWVQGNKAH